MQVLLGLIDASPNQEKWEIFYKALKNNDFEHVITALKYEKIPQTVRKVYSELLLQPENVKQLHGLLSPDSQKKLVERNVLFKEDIDNISSEREMTESDTAAVLVLLDRLWRKNTKWIEELSNIFKLKDDVFSQKLFLYCAGAEETEPKEVSNVVKEDKGVKTKYDRNQRQKAKPEQEETEPKTLLRTDAQPMHVASGTSENNQENGTKGSLFTFFKEESTSLSNLPKEVGIDLSSMLEDSAERLEPILDSKTGEFEPYREIVRSQYRAYEESDIGEFVQTDDDVDATEEATTGVIDQIALELDASVERSRLRNDSAMYRRRCWGTMSTLFPKVAILNGKHTTQ